MELYNAIIKLDTERLNFPRPTLHARQLHSFTAIIRDIPDDVTDVILRIYKIDRQAHFDIPVSRRGESAQGEAYIIGTCFPDCGTSYYEIHAYDSRGNATSLGRGGVCIDAFGGTGSPIEPGQSVPIMQITDATGALHTIRAVSDGEGGYTPIIDMEVNQ